MSLSPKPIDRDNARRWAEHWIATWNALDIETVLALFADDCRFRSPKAATITGRGTVLGKTALRDYWTRAVAGIGSLRFTLESAHWDDAGRTLLVRYIAELGAQRLLAAEVFDFNPEGQVRCGTALYGAPAD
ncbi:MAG: hypothetical protein C0434_01045 [Xanthomonadaceae bacterium]|nr:hypothetical protein [Xanthomonadaceae bacterium]